MRTSAAIFLVLSCLASFIYGFIQPQPCHKCNNNNIVFTSPNLPSAFVVSSSAYKTQQAKRGLETAPVIFRRQRKSMAIVATQGLFGLGAAEIAIILVAAAFLLGPQKLAELGRDAGKMAGELKEVPKEFQKGIAEGEKEALKMKEDSMKQIEGSGTVKDAETVEEKK